MPAPIVFPSLARYQTIVGLCALPGNVGQIQNIFAVDDNSFAIFRWDSGAQNPNYSWECFVVDVPSLAITHYASTGMSGNLQTQPILFGAGNFLLPWNDGTTYFFSPRNLKLNNPSPILIAPSLTIIPQEKCGAVFSKVYYDDVNKVVAIGYYNALNGSMYTSAYQVGSDGSLIRKASGFPAFWSIRDTWDQTGGLAGAQICTNNISVLAAGNPTVVYRQRFFINLGIDQNACYLDTRVFNSVSACVAAGFGVIQINPDGSVIGQVTSTSFSGQYVLNIFQTAFNTGEALPIGGLCDSSIPGLVGYSDGNGVNLFGDGGVWYYLPVQFGGITNSAVTKNFVAGVISFHGMSIGFFQSPSASQLVNGGSITRNTWKLSNYARPISVTGKYKA